MPINEIFSTMKARLENSYKKYPRTEEVNIEGVELRRGVTNLEMRSAWTWGGVAARSLTMMVTQWTTDLFCFVYLQPKHRHALTCNMHPLLLVLPQWMPERLHSYFLSIWQSVIAHHSCFFTHYFCKRKQFSLKNTTFCLDKSWMLPL